MILVSKRRAAWSELKEYCHHAGEHDHMEVTVWSNGEGVDISIDRKDSNERLSMTYGEWELLTVLMNWKGE